MSLFVKNLSTKTAFVRCLHLVFCGFCVSSIFPAVALGQTRLNGELVPGGAVWDFAISPDSRTVVYLADQETDNLDELFAVPIQGGSALKLSGGEVGENGEVFPLQFITADNERVVYTTRDTRNFFSVPITGGTAPIQIVDVANEPTVSIPRDQYQTTSDGQWMVYSGNPNNSANAEIVSVSLTNGRNTILNGPLTGDGDVRVYDITADNRTVVFDSEDPTVPRIRHIQSAPIDGGSLQTIYSLDNPENLFVDITGFELTPTDILLFISDFESPSSGDDILQLYSLDINSGSLRRLNDPLTIGEDVRNFILSRDGARAVYSVADDNGDIRALYSVSTGGGEVVRITPDLGLDSRIEEGFEFTADGGTVIYLANESFGEVRTVYATRTMGGGDPRHVD